jgi:hypothetical protein
MTPKEFYESLQEKKPFTELTSTGISDNLPNVFEFAKMYAEAISVTRCCEELPRWTNNDVDSAYLMGCMNVGGIDEISKELKRLEELGLKPHEAVGKVRGKW